MGSIMLKIPDGVIFICALASIVLFVLKVWGWLSWPWLHIFYPIIFSFAALLFCAIITVSIDAYKDVRGNKK